MAAVQGISSGDFSNLLTGVQSESLATKISKLNNAITGGKLSESQKMEAMAQLTKLESQQESQGAKNPNNQLAKTDIFTFAKQNPQTKNS